MKQLLLALGLGLLAAIAGCSISHSKTEQRVIELPKGHPQSTLVTAQQICQQVVASGLEAKVRERFPALTPQQMSGLFLRPMSGNFAQGGETTFILAGIRYEGVQPQAAQIAAFIEGQVRAAVIAQLGSVAPSRGP